MIRLLPFISLQLVLVYFDWSLLCGYNIVFGVATRYIHTHRDTPQSYKEPNLKREEACHGDTGNLFLLVLTLLETPFETVSLNGKIVWRCFRGNQGY